MQRPPRRPSDEPPPRSCVLAAQGLVDERDMRTRSSDDAGGSQAIGAFYPAAAGPSGRPSLDVSHPEERHALQAQAGGVSSRAAVLTGQPT